MRILPSEAAAVAVMRKTTYLPGAAASAELAIPLQLCGRVPIDDPALGEIHVHDEDDLERVKEI